MHGIAGRMLASLALRRGIEIADEKIKHARHPAGDQFDDFFVFLFLQ
jgi:hypothetical protein